MSRFDEHDLIRSMKNGTLVKNNRVWDSLMLVMLGNPVEILKLCSKHKILLNYTMCKYLINNEEAMKLIFEYDKFDVNAIKHLRSKVKSDEVMLLFIQKMKSDICCEWFYYMLSNRFGKSIKYMIDNNLHYDQYITNIYETCDVNLLNLVGLELSSFKFLTVACSYTECYKRIKTYGKIDNFDLIWYSQLSNTGPKFWLSMIESNYINFTGLNKLAKSHDNKKELIKLAVENTINLPINSKTCDRYFNITLPKIMSNYLLLDLSKLVVSYL